MAFTDHKITAFANRVSDLADQPNLPPQELKARFDACPEELRVAVNGMCDEGDALAARIDAYRAQTFEGEITRDMLTPEVQAELSGKADQTALTAEQNARLSLASNNTAAHKSLQTEIAKKCEIFIGTFVGDGAESQFIRLGVTPRAVMITAKNGIPHEDTTLFGGFATADSPCEAASGTTIEIVPNGFTVYNKTRCHINTLNDTRRFIAFV